MNSAQLIGSWKAETLSYQFGDHKGTYPFDHEYLKQGCKTDILVINDDFTVALHENNRVEDQCKDFITQGKVEDEIIVFDNHQRLIDSVDDSKLLLKYPLTMMGQTIEVTVEYSKQ